jgi:hypothetical protein
MTSAILTESSVGYPFYCTMSLGVDNNLSNYSCHRRLSECLTAVFSVSVLRSNLHLRLKIITLLASNIKATSQNFEYDFLQSGYKTY